MRTIGTASRVLGVFLACGSVVAALAWAAPPAQAFSTGPHFDLSTDVLLREGVPANSDAMRTIRVANYQVTAPVRLGMSSPIQIPSPSTPSGIRSIRLLRAT